MEPTVSYLTFNEVGVTIAVIAVAMTFIVLTWNAVKAIREWLASAKKPTDDRLQEDESRIEDHEQRITRLEGCCDEVRGKLQSDWEWQQSAAEKDELMLKSIKQLLKHSVDGNDTQGLVKMEAEIDDYLIKHQQR